MSTVTTTEARAIVARPPSAYVVVRRRRVLTVLAGAGFGCALLAAAGLTALWWLTLLFVALAGGYLSLVARLRHIRVRRQIDQAFGADVQQADKFDWRALDRDVRLSIAEEHDAVVLPADRMEVGNRAIGRFLLCWALGWVLTPIVTVMRLVRGDLSVLERQGMAERIVSWQQYGRSQSLRLLTVGAAASVGITAVGGLTGGAGATSRPAVVSTTSHASGTPSTYTVVAGDTLSAIAARTGTSVAALAAANHLANPNLILRGQVLTLTGPAAASPPVATSSTYTVRPGDTLYAIARTHATTVAQLAADNHIANPNLIFAGQVFTIPAATPAATPAPAHATVAVTPAPAPAPAATPAAAPVPAPAPVPVAKAAAAPAAAPAPAPVAQSALPLPAQYLKGGTVDQGVDYAAPGGTPLFAMGPGKVIREGMSGFGANTPVLQITGGPLAGKSVYYGHAGADLVTVGATVAAGQQISVVGYGIVGYSTGPHLEVGFYPPGPNGSGRAMLDYLNGAVGHSTGR